MTKHAATATDQETSASVERVPTPMPYEIDEYKQFVDEVGHTLDRMEVNLVLQDGERDNHARLAEMSRDLELIRSRAARMQLTDVKRCAEETHRLTTLLNRGGVPLSDTLVKVLARTCQVIREEVNRVIPAVRSLRLMSRSAKVPELLDLIRMATAEAVIAQAQEQTSKPSIPVPPSEQSPIPKLAGDIHCTRADFDTLSSRIEELQDVAVLFGGDPALQGEVGKDLRVHLHRLQQVASELRQQQRQMSTAPANTLSKYFKRLADETANSAKKEVSLKLEGGDTRLDIDLLAAIKAPLSQLVICLIEHSLELPVERSVDCKHQRGTLTLTISETNGNPRFVLADDGVGLEEETPLERIREDLEKLGAKFKHSSEEGQGASIEIWWLSEGGARGVPTPGIRDI